MLYHSHLCGCSFFNVSIHTIVVSPIRSNDSIISRSTFWVSGSLWWIAYTEIVTFNGEMLICQLSKNFTVYASVDVEQRISKVTYNVLQTSCEDAVLTSRV